MGVGCRDSCHLHLAVVRTALSKPVLLSALENLKHREPAEPSEYHLDVQSRAVPASSQPRPP